jgi:hypothetical protein
MSVSGVAEGIAGRDEVGLENITLGRVFLAPPVSATRTRLPSRMRGPTNIDKASKNATRLSLPTPMLVEVILYSKVY